MFKSKENVEISQNNPKEDDVFQKKPDQKVNQNDSSLKIAIGFLFFLVVFLGALRFWPFSSDSTAFPTGLQTPTPTTEPTPTLIISPSPLTSPTTQAAPDTSQTKFLLDLSESTAYGGDQTVRLSFDQLANWSTKTAVLPKPEGALRDCVEIRVQNDSNASGEPSAELRIRPICTGWSATYEVRPSDSVVIAEETKTDPNGSRSTQTIRYQPEDSNTYVYETAENNLDAKKMGALMMLADNSEYFLAATVEVVPLNSDQIDAETLFLMDNIVKSVKVTTISASPTPPHAISPSPSSE